MRVDYQWTTDPAVGWLSIDSRDWNTLAAKNEPIGGETVDSTFGWIFSVNIQGVIFTGDHYAVRHSDSDGGVLVYCWNDDEEDYPPGEKYGRVWLFEPLAVEAINTRQTMTFYAEENVLARTNYDIETSSGPILKLDYSNWSEVLKPEVNVATRHGVWVTDDLAAAHQAFKPAGWRDWAGDVP